MYTLDLYKMGDEDLPLSRITIELGDVGGASALIGHSYVEVSKESDLYRVPAGANPRALNISSKKVKNIRNTLETAPGFAVYNGGICVVIDDGSFVYDSETEDISFSCNQPGSGHYDGQHTLEALRQGSDKATDQQVAVTFVENCFFEDVHQIRKAAECWNSRESQKLNSEQNLRGLFDFFKSCLDTRHKTNIGWRENDRNDSGELIQKECRIDRVISLLYTAVPVLRSDYLDTGDEMHGMLRKGYRSSNLLEEENQRTDFEKLYPHADLILDLSDYMQKNMRSSYEAGATVPETFDTLHVVRKCTKAAMRKDVSKRKFWSQQLFDGTSVSGALLPDYMQPVMYGFLKNVLKLDRKTGSVIIKHGLSKDDLYAIWDEAGYAVLHMLESRFRKYFKSRFNSRHAEFGCWPNLWDRCADIFEETIDSGSWRRSLAAK